MDGLQELWEVVRSIPAGRAMAYGQVGRALKHPATGRMVGRWMKQCPPDLPWWRVVGHDGRFPIGKQSPQQEFEQEQLLIDEGVPMENGRVSPAAMLSFDELPS